MKRIVSLGAAALAVSLLGAGKAQAADIVETAMSAPQFSTLVKAVKAAGLVDTLKGEGPFTVFAPTNEAFAKLPPGTLESLLRPENKDKLVAVLTYHVLPKRADAQSVAAAPSGATARTVQGQPIKIYNRHGVKINRANVIKTDIAADNGVIHVIDQVLLPPM